MKADAGRRYRLYPTPAQAERLTGWGHSCRAVWNLALAQRQFAYAQRGRTLRAVEQCRHLTAARRDPDLAWLTDLPAQAAQQILHQLDRAYDNWWNPDHPAGTANIQEAQPWQDGGAVPRTGHRGPQAYDLVRDRERGALS